MGRKPPALKATPDMTRAQLFALDVRRRLVDIRVCLGLTQADIAEHIGVYPPTVGDWERNEATFNLLRLYDYAEALGYTVHIEFEERQ